MTVLVRAAGPADDAVLGELLVRAFASRYALKLPHIVMSPERLADLRNIADKRRDALVLVAAVDGSVAGSVTLYRAGAPGNEAWLLGASSLRYLAVDAAWQGLGLSATLMDAAEARARHWGTAAVCLHVRRECDGVARFYARRGYRRDPTGDRDRRPQVFLEGYVLDL